MTQPRKVDSEFVQMLEWLFQEWEDSVRASTVVPDDYKLDQMNKASQFVRWVKNRGGGHLPRSSKRR